MRGVIAAGHPLSAESGAEVLRAGGNAVDAALGAMLTSFVCEPLLTGLGAGGYMLVAPQGGEPVLLDFFVEAPGRDLETDPARPRAELVPVAISFGSAVQTFNIGVASVGAYGVPAGVCAAAERFGTIPLAELVRPAAQHARAGVPLNDQQAYIVEILAGIITATPECAALLAPGGRPLRAGDVFRMPELADSLERLGEEGADPFYTGDIARAITSYIGSRGGLLMGADLAAYAVIDRTPISVDYRGRKVLTNPPPSAGGILIAWALAMLAAATDRSGPPTPAQIADVMERAQHERTPAFLEGLADPGFVKRFLERTSPAATPGPLGSTTHIAVIDADGWACSVTCSAGSGSGIIVPGTGVHLNNMLGEQDLNPLGFHRHPPGRRLPSMMAPTAVMRDGAPELVLGSAGSNRIRSAILQTVVRVLDEGMRAQDAVEAPRLHFEDGAVYAEPGIALAALDDGGRRQVVPFADRNLFFGGTQAVQRDAEGRFWGGGDPRRGGAAVVVL
jgi:gamma-glutamyltranspeptidase/glutathione hydrolase